MPSYQFHTKGLTDRQVQESRARHGINKTDQKKESGFLIAAKNLLKEPMFLLLLAASAIYFISGKTGDGIFMASAIQSYVLDCPLRWVILMSWYSDLKETTSLRIGVGKSKR